ncbi:MAG: LOG family protein [Hyphomicrobiales bacterium]
MSDSLKRPEFRRRRTTVFHTSEEDLFNARLTPRTPQTESPAYRLAFADGDFLTREELRPVRLQLELLKPEVYMQEHGIESTVIVFGSARIPAPGSEPGGKSEIQRKNLASKAKYYEMARKFSELVSHASKERDCKEYVITSGGGPGIMEAANLGATDAGACSIGLNIVLPHEQKPNDYVTPELCFNFHYFAIRKMHFLMRARAVAAFPGGFGTMDELFEVLTLIQTERVEPMPIVLFGREFWEGIINFQALADGGTISYDDLKLFQIVETAEEGWAVIRDYYGL